MQDEGDEVSASPREVSSLSSNSPETQGPQGNGRFAVYMFLSSKWISFRRWPATEWALDCFWPSVDLGDRTEEDSRRAQDLTAVMTAIGALFDKTAKGSEERRTAAVADSLALLEAESTRRQSIESRLTSIVGFVALASTIALWLLGAQLAGTLGRGRSIATFVLLSYLVVQLVRAGLASVDGLRRRSFRSVTVGLYFEQDNLRELVSERVACAFQHEEIVNGKVERLAVAHRALKNFLIGLLLLTSVVGWRFCTAGPPSSTVSNEALDMIRGNRELRDELRGEPGPEGSRGPTGPRGSHGARGPGGPARDPADSPPALTLDPPAGGSGGPRRKMGSEAVEALGEE